MATSSMYPKKEETLTARNIADSYAYAFQALHDRVPECEHLEGRWFMVDGIRRDRHWMVLEVERLRQEALTQALDESRNQSTSNIFKMIRRLSRL
ncbi:MAG: hypothetical protein ACLFTK_02970 [Anaerolineales bacterium]